MFPVGQELEPHSILKSRDITLLTNIRIVKAMVFPVVMHGCESWTLKKAKHRWMMLGCLLSKSPLDSKEIKPLNCKGNQSWIFIERTNAKAAVLWPPDAKNWLLWKDPDAGKDWRWEEKGTTEDEVVGWHHWLNGHEFEQNLGMVKDREAWRAAVHEVAKSWTWLRDWTTNRYLDR